MKISIWQQFSSNHSANFTIIGQFESAEEAQKRHAELLSILQDIQTTVRQDLEGWYGTVAVTPIERQYAEKYNIEWYETIDWINFYQILDPLVVWDDLVLYDPLVTSWQTGHQVANLLKAMGADVYRNVMEGRDPNFENNLWMFVDVQIQCVLNDKSIFQELDQHLHISNLGHIYQNYESNDYHASMPWSVYHPNYDALSSNMNRDVFFEQQQTFLEESLAWYLSKDEKKDADTFFTQDRQIRQMINQLRQETSFSFKEIQHQIDRLIFNDFSSSYMSYALPAFLSWLRVTGCQVTYSFVQR